MSMRSRLERLVRRLDPPRDVGPPTVLYVAVPLGEPTGVTPARGGAAREVRYAAGTPPPLVRGPRELILGPAVEVRRGPDPAETLSNPIKTCHPDPRGRP